MGPKKMHISQLQEEPSITDLSQPHPNDMRATLSRRGGYGTGNSGDGGNRITRREDSRGYGRGDGGMRYENTEEADACENWRRPDKQRTMSGTGPRSRGAYDDKPSWGTMIESKTSSSHTVGDSSCWRNSNSAAPSPVVRHNFSFLKGQISQSSVTPTQSPQKSADPPVSSPPPKSEGGLLHQTAASAPEPLVTRELSKPALPPRATPAIDKPRPRVEYKLERTRAVSGPPPKETVSTGRKKTSLDALHAGQPVLSSHGSSRSAVIAVKKEGLLPTSADEEEKVEKKRKKVNDKKAAIRAAAAAKKIVSKPSVKKCDFKGSRNDISVITDKLEVIFEEDSSANPADILKSITDSVDRSVIVLDSSLILACLVAMCVREVIRHAEGTDEAGLPADTPAVKLEELVDTKLFPEASSSWRKVIPLLEALKSQVSYSSEFDYVLLVEILRICPQSGCPRLSPTLTLTELMLLSLMHTSKAFLSPALVLEWVSDIQDETEGRALALVQTANMIKWLRGRLAPESADEGSESDND